MLVTYTPISALTPEQVTRLRAMVAGRRLTETAGPIVLDGLALNPAEVRAHARIWENQSPTRTALFG